MGVNEARMALWTDALESGEYEQGPGRLCSWRLPDPRKYCCLGVAVMVAYKNGFRITEDLLRDREIQLEPWEMALVTNPESDVPNDLLWQVIGNGTLHEWYEVAAWYGVELEDDRAFILSEESDADGDPIAAVEANDKLGWDFPRIAQALRARYIAGGQS
jgi:hypothetical protein